MAPLSSTTSTQMICAVCMKGKGTFKCEGCSQIYCSKHSINHRHELNQKLEEIELTRDLIYETFIQQSDQFQKHSLLNQIDQWEHNSVDKIHQTAEEARIEVLQGMIDFEQKFKDITNQLQQAHENDDFVEIDLNQWAQKLDELEKKLIDSKSILIEEKSTAFLTKILIRRSNTSDIFQYVCGDIQIEDNGYRIRKDNWIGFSEVLGKKEYINGQHRIRFKIEELHENGWMLFGIISNSETMNINSYIFPSSYGWTTQDQICIAGQYQEEQNNDIIQNDIISLIIDCDRRRIQMKNEHTGHTMELTIDVNKCSFPWKLHFNLLTASISIRILPSTD